MAKSVLSKLHEKFNTKNRMYGTTTLGARGQLVIPAEARKELGLEPGDRLLVTGKFGKVLGLIKANEIEDIMSSILEKIDDQDLRASVAKEAKQFLKYKQ